MARAVSAFSALRSELESISSTFRHASNLRAQFDKTPRPPSRTASLIQLGISYLHFARVAAVARKTTEHWIANVLAPMNAYLDMLYLEGTTVVRHQSDFISSFLPEAFHRLLLRIVAEQTETFVVESQRDILIECMFSPSNGGLFLPKRKRVDVALLKPVSLEFRGLAVPDFGIPLVAMEVKTNLDKNMLSGIEHSVERLKSTFPKCQYYVVTELADFEIEAQNYAASGIDEIVVLRKQTRSHVRRGTPREHLNQADLLYFCEKARQVIRDAESPLPHIAHRMSGGRLIAFPRS